MPRVGRLPPLSAEQKRNRSNELRRERAKRNPDCKVSPLICLARLTRLLLLSSYR